MENIFNLIKFILLYALLLIYIPAKVMGMRFTVGRISHVAFKALTVSHTVLILIVYILGMMGIYNRVTLIGCSLLVCLICVGINYKPQGRWKRFAAGFRNILSGGLRMRIFAGQLFSRAVFRMKEWLHEVGGLFLNARFLCYCVEAVSLVILAVRRFCLVWNNYAYATSDMYVHHNWINYLENNVIFYDGVYPFGMHNMLSAFHFFTGMNMNYIMRFWGPFSAVLTVLTLVFLMRRIFHSEAVVMAAMVIYCVADFAGVEYAWRFAATLPQECGVLFLLPCAWFLGKYLSEEQKEDGFYFVLCASLMISMHFYTVIFGVILCFFIVLVFFKRVLRLQMIKKLLLMLGLIALIAIAPLVAGLLGGRYWQGSIGWALGVMNSGRSAAVEQTETVETTGQETELPEELTVETLDPEYEKQQTEEQSGMSIMVKLQQKAEELIEIQRWNMGMLWTVLLLFGMCLMLPALILLLLARRGEWKVRMLLSVCCFTIILFVMRNCEIFGLPRLIQSMRIQMFLGLVAPVIMAAPLDLLMMVPAGIIHGAGCLLSGAATLALFIRTYGYGYMPDQSYYYLQNSLDAEACVRIMEEYEDFTWTVVSPVEAASLVRNYGYHYELWEFISEMECYNGEKHLEIPTRDVFFILEKKPLPYNEIRVVSKTYDDPGFTREQAQRAVTLEALDTSENDVMHYYNVYENRCSLEAKLYYWITEYSKYHPDEMEVFMENDDCVVYHYRQSGIAWDNFCIPYEFNE